MSITKLRELNKFSDRLIFLRGKRSKAEFAREIGVSQPLYHQWENGAIPTYDKALLIAKACNVPVDVLLTGHNAMHTLTVTHQTNRTGIISSEVKDAGEPYGTSQCENCVLLKSKLSAMQDLLDRANASLDIFIKHEREKAKK